MSVKLMTLVFDAEFPDLVYTKREKERKAKASTVTLVLLAYADQANDEGEAAYPGYKRLLRKTCLSKQGLADTLDALKQNEFLTLKGRSKLNTNEYNINIEAIKQFVKPVDKQKSSHLTKKVKPVGYIPPNTPTNPPKSNGRKSAKDYPGVMLVHSITGRYPRRETYDLVQAAIDAMALRLKREVIKDDLRPFRNEWIERAYNPLSIKWLTEWAVSGKIPQNGKKPRTQPQGFDAVERWAEKEGING